MEEGIIVLNAGSSTMKFSLFTTKGKNLMRGKIDKLGTEKSHTEITIEGKTIIERTTTKDHVQAAVKAIHTIKKYGFLKKTRIKYIGHRVVHGGEKFWEPTIITARVIERIKTLTPLAPLHNPPAIAGILVTKKLFPKTKQYAIFDTAFHHTIPKEAFLYGLPIKLYEEEGIRKYGFHGISHEYVAKQARKLLLKKEHEEEEIITCHLGNGSSVTAIKNGKSIDTSMGFTPLDGLIMGTRSGDLDPEIIIYLLERKKYTLEELKEMLNKASGLKGITGTSDMREIHERAIKKDPLAKLAINMLAYRIAKYIGSYATALEGLEAIIFTGGIGENAYYIRRKVIKHLKFLGVEIDPHKNRKNEIIISTPRSKIKVFVIPTDEERAIAEKIIEKEEKKNNNKIK